MNYKTKLIIPILLFSSLYSCNKRCDHSNCTTEIVREKIVLKDPVEFKNRPKNIVLMIGDGMGIAQIYAGMTRNKNYLNLERCKDIGFIKT